MIYIIRSGDTLFIIAQRFNTTVDAILAANPQITNPNIIFPGQVITLPSTQPGQLCPILRQGDRGPAVIRLQTLLNVAGFSPGIIDGIFGPRTQSALIAFQQSLRELDVTGIADIETWTALGAECQPSPEIIRYIVRPGDTLFIIANRFGITINEILRINPQITNPNIIFPWQVINIPSR